MRSVSFAVLGLALLLPVRADDEAPTSRPSAKLPPLGAPAGSFGATLDEKTERVALADLAATPEKWAGKTILVTAAIEDVCSKKGCWMVLGQGPQAMRVKFKDYAFFVPRDAKGRVAMIQGQAKVEEVSEADARHYAEESGQPDKAKEIHGPQRSLSFLATGAEVLGSFALPTQAKGEPAAVEALRARVRAAAGPETDTRSYEAVSAELALRKLRETPRVRTLELAAWAQVDSWYVFGVGGDKGPFARAWAVHVGGHRVIELAGE